MNKNAIKNFAVWARVTLINAVTQRAYEYEVTEGGVNDHAQESVNGKSLTMTEKSQRAQLISNINANGFSQTMEEAAYTWFNRFIALRFMEVNNYLPSHTRIFSDESGAFMPEVLSDAVNLDLDGLDRELVLEMLENQQNEQLYKYIIITQCNALNEGLPEMFEQIGGWTELLFPPNLLRQDSVIAHMVGDIPEDDWRDQVQIIGWLYQYYNTEPKDKVFADLKKNIKIGAEAIPAATQLFTPDWIVRYMVENSLGRLWTEGHGKPDSAEWKYYLDEAEQEDSVKSELAKIRAEYKNIQPEQIRFLDPCMGSGHILVYAFDVLMDIYTSCGWSERDAAKSILRHNLFGLDIDRRAYQLAYFSVMMKARQYNRRIFSAENQPNLANFADVSGADTSMVVGRVRQLAEQFTDADIYGSLMTVKAPDGIDDELSDYMPTFGLDLRQLEMMMKIYHILGQKYDVVCTNPPYMGGSGMNAKLSDFVKKYYPNTKSDLSTCFMEKCEKLCKDSGFYTMLNIPVWMFLSSYEKLREAILTNNSYSSMVHFGRGVFGSDFGTTAFVISKKHISDYIAVYRRLFEKQGAVDTVEQKEKWFFEGMGYYTAKQENFSKIPGMPVAYWVSENFVRAFENPKLGDIASPRQGLACGDVNRFRRMWHEIEYNRINFSATSIEDFHKSTKKYAPINDGGSYKKWYGNNECVLMFSEEDYSVLLNIGNHLPSREMYFKRGVTWTAISSSTFSVRYFYNGFLFSNAGMAIFGDDDSIEYILGLLNSKISINILAVLCPTMNFNAGDIKNIPVKKSAQDVRSLVRQTIDISEKEYDCYETSWDFERHPLI